MIKEIREIKAKGTAWKLTQEYCLDTAGPIPVEDIAMDNGVLCLEGPLTGCLARLVRKGNRGIIRTRNDIREAGRRRFAIAHELGHWFLHESESQVFICTGENMGDYRGSPIEVEANLFASELLMPTHLFKPLVESVDPRLATIKMLAGMFNTSLTATAMKFVDLNRHECILVLSVNGAIAWSKQKGKRSGLRIEKGNALHPDSLANRVPKPSGQLGPELVSVDAWISQNACNRSIEVTEESWALDGYNSVLTLLMVTDTDGEEDHDMVQHYTRKTTARAAEARPNGAGTR